MKVSRFKLRHCTIQKCHSAGTEKNLKTHDDDDDDDLEPVSKFAS